MAAGTFTGGVSWNSFSLTPFRNHDLSKNLLAPLLSNVINERICDGVFPNNLKIAKVVPIFKPGGSEIPTNYRPVSVLTYFSNIFEKVLYGRLNDYFTKNNLSQQQYGFRNNHSTSLAITDLYENLLQKLDKKTYIMCGFLRSEKSIWLCESLYFANKTRALRRKRKCAQTNTVLSLQQKTVRSRGKY